MTLSSVPVNHTCLPISIIIPLQDEYTLLVEFVYTCYHWLPDPTVTFGDSITETQLLVKLHVSIL
jgi:hypothetical protein